VTGCGRHCGGSASRRHRAWVRGTESGVRNGGAKQPCPCPLYLLREPEGRKTAPKPQRGKSREGAGGTNRCNCRSEFRDRARDRQGLCGSGRQGHHAQSVRRKPRHAARTVSGAPRVAAMDMLDRPAVARAVASIGAIDHLVLTAVADENARRAPLAKLSADQIEGGLDKLRGFINVAQAAAPIIRERGSIRTIVRRLRRQAAARGDVGSCRGECVDRRLWQGPGPGAGADPV
jgi:hypothetical protein